MRMLRLRSQTIQHMDSQEKIPAFGESATAAALAKRPSITGLIDLDVEQDPSWRPLFVNDVEGEVPDVGEGSGAVEQEPSKNKGKEKSHLYADGLSGANVQAPPILGDNLPEGLPCAYQIIAGRDARKCPQYDYSNLYNGLPVPELWNDKGDTLVYLCPKNKTTPQGPSFLVDSLTLQSTSDYWGTAFSPVWQGGFEIDKSTYPTANFALFFAADRPDGRNEETDPLALLRHYVTMRNVFACMFDSFCVGLIEEDSPLLSDLVDRMLMYFDGSEDSLGVRLSGFIRKSGLWDVSNDPIKAVDLLHLAATYEMKDLYLEAFAHSVGMWPQVLDSKAHEVLPDPIIALLASHHKKLADTIGVFSQIMKGFSLKELWAFSSPATKLPSAVRKGYESMRTFLYKYYTSLFQEWPPKDLTTRPVLLGIYSDFCALYRLLVDRQYTSAEACACYASLVKYVQALHYIDRTICNRDISIPYGIPILPGYFAQAINESASIRRPEIYRVDMEEKLKPEELDRVFENMYSAPHIQNSESETAKSITTAFIEFEKSLMRGKTVKGVAETRKGIWLWIYAILDIMAELSVETGVVFKDDVEYLLCADTTDVFDWDGKRGKEDIQQSAGSGDTAVDRRDLEGNNAQPGAQPPPVVRSSTTTRPRVTRAEMSYPWALAKTPGWCIGARERGG
ncbi:hypothetical protein TWF718_002883 [Orbilia javanica]|uniref:DUF8004 domain-containing protein n=1 Tax=Orbilia javanica TaxID=47235 RepID=A0AAN8MLI7_9PEZI